MVVQTAISQLSAAMSDQPAPIYQRVKQAIISQISEGVWKANQRVPSESELVNELGVSRMTINRALRELTSEGYLMRMQGVGTFVAEMKGYTAMLEVHNIAEEIAQRGHRHSCKILTLRESKADPEQAAVLGLTTGQTLFQSLIVHFENDLPVQLEERVVNPLVAPDYLQQDYHSQTPYTYLMRVAPLTAGEHIVEAVLPDAQQCQLLAIEAQEPCLLIRRQTWSDSKVVTYAKLLYPGSRYKLLGRFKSHG
ncbi:histidine utilization repressor [Erwinia aphidicola]|jgi:GntR family histidine utilization transcriptional repressor|uniref:histidine utilization repressor n=1 Tax=Erwinia aphidicola TaxID=68334 RepID=UPI0006645D41|nr:histidine utilization repressor [Erwinia aphidicola]KMV69717.1 histidine utilization repressor [bacteria symbiont BFo1 of Frankliniella occidentalis]PIJ59191.1 histidine utilization repressor [Erwinia sp. OLMDLW33]KYP83773.1 histidine utilization repressor [bacteria symbiont BFo1 of Frankliniella occidentalis]KYP89152.1 histidine utilization repressor [bacteria symbiont BFo1 of Frankliniella occidentalis]MBN1085180.1 histidine utilization repressor [Erwinia aphidicola]